MSTFANAPGRRRRPDEPVTVPFGTHKGRPVEDAETGLLVWWADKLHAEYWAVVAELVSRREWPRRLQVPPPGAELPPGAPHPATDPDIMADLRQLLRNWFREMSKRHHPDRAGGSDAAQRIVTEGLQVMTDLLNNLEEEAKGP